MAKARAVHVCTACGGESPKWQGQCPHCNAWNTLVESVAESAAPARYQGLAEASRVTRLSDVDAQEAPRRSTGVGELDRVLGGGLVRGAVVLLGGDPARGSLAGLPPRRKRGPARNVGSLALWSSSASDRAGARRRRRAVRER